MPRLGWEFSPRARSEQPYGRGQPPCQRAPPETSPGSPEPTVGSLRSSRGSPSSYRESPRELPQKATTDLSHLTRRIRRIPLTWWPRPGTLEWASDGSGLADPERAMGKKGSDGDSGPPARRDTM